MEEGIKLDLKEDPEVKKGKYSNMAVVIMEEGEIVLDFLHYLPTTKGVKEGELLSRIIMTPTQTKRLIVRLLEWMKYYEEKIGEIPINFEFLNQKCLPTE